VPISRRVPTGSPNIYLFLVRGWNPDVIERQLAHIEGNRVRAAYHRALYLEDRVKLLQWWADYLDGRKTGKVVKLPKRKA